MTDSAAALERWRHLNFAFLHWFGSFTSYILHPLINHFHISATVCGSRQACPTKSQVIRSVVCTVPSPITAGGDKVRIPFWQNWQVKQKSQIMHEDKLEHTLRKPDTIFEKLPYYCRLESWVQEVDWVWYWVVSLNTFVLWPPITITTLSPCRPLGCGC